MPIIVFDVCDETSYNWMLEFAELGADYENRERVPHIPCAIVGTNVDRESERAVDPMESQYYEFSACDACNGSAVAQRALDSLVAQL